MPLIGIDTYIIDFAILETNDAKSITLMDKSHYLTTPEKPMIAVTLPGYTGYIEFPYTPYTPITPFTPNTVIVINSDTLSLTDGLNYESCLRDLPDGVYQITMKVCPYNELFKKQCYLKTTVFDNQFAEMLLNIDINCGCLDENILRDQLLDIDILIQSAKAETRICNVEKATDKYRMALAKLNSLITKLKCK